MQKYEGRHIEVQAIRLTKQNVQEVVEWCDGHQVEEIDPLNPDQTFVGINLPTLRGWQRASESDYIVKGIAGEFWPLRAQDFEERYTPID